MSYSHRVLSSMAAAVSMLSAPEAFAQDANLESRLDNAIIQSPPPVARPRVVEETVITMQPTTRVVTVNKEKSVYRLYAIVSKDRGGMRTFSALPAGDRSFEALCAEINAANAEKKRKNQKTESCYYPGKKVIHGSKPVASKKEVKKPDVTKLTLTAPTSENFQTNALSQPDARADRQFTAGVDATLSIQLNADYTLGFNANYTGLRYDRFDLQDRDALTGFVTLSRAITVNQSITAKFQSRSSWRPGFEGEPTVFHTPSLQWNILNIDLGGPQCGIGAGAKSCVGWTVALGAGHTFVESTPTSDNTFANLQVGAAWALIPNKLSWLSSGKLTGRNYQRTTADREDLQFDASTGLEWTPSPNVILSAGGAYTRNDSSFDPVEYTNYQFQPQIKLKWVFE